MLHGCIVKVMCSVVCGNTCGDTVVICDVDMGYISCQALIKKYVSFEIYDAPRNTRLV